MAKKYYDRYHKTTAYSDTFRARSYDGARKQAREKGQVLGGTFVRKTSTPGVSVYRMVYTRRKPRGILKGLVK